MKKTRNIIFIWPKYFSREKKFFLRNFFRLAIDLRIRLTTCCWPLHVVGLRHHDLGDLQPCGRGLFRQRSWNIAARGQRRAHVAVQRRKLDPRWRFRRWPPPQRSKWSGVRHSNRWTWVSILLCKSRYLQWNETWGIVASSWLKALDLLIWVTF